MNGFVGFIIIALFVAALLVGWFFWTQHRAKRLGLPSPPLSSYLLFWKRDGAGFASGGSGPRAGGVVGWVKDKVDSIRHRRGPDSRGGIGGGGGGAYEETGLSNVRGRQDHRGFGPLDPDDAWDARVGNEADTYGPGGLYGEEHDDDDEGRHSLDRHGAGQGAMRNLVPEPYIGGSKAGLDRRYDEEMGRSPQVDTNPFGDSAEPSHITTAGAGAGASMSGGGRSRRGDDDATDERRSIFKENV